MATKTIISASVDTDIALRLARTIDRGDRSQFINDALRSRLFTCELADNDEGQL